MAVLSDAQREAGWTIAKLGDIAPLTYGKSLVASKRIPGDVPVYSSAGLIDSHNESIIDGQNIIIGRKELSVQLHGAKVLLILSIQLSILPVQKR